MGRKIVGIFLLGKKKIARRSSASAMPDGKLKRLFPEYPMGDLYYDVQQMTQRKKTLMQGRNRVVTHTHQRKTTSVAFSRQRGNHYRRSSKNHINSTSFTNKF